MDRNAFLFSSPLAIAGGILALLPMAALAQNTPPGNAGRPVATAGAVARSTQEIVDLYLYDYAYDSWIHACAAAAAAGKTLIGTQHWLGLATQTCQANVQMTGSGMLQPASSALLTLAGSFTSPDSKTLDTSLGGPGSIIFSGKVGRAHAEWFGAVLIDNPFGMVQNSVATENTRAVRSAIAAFPVAQGVLEKGGIPARYGSAQFGCGTLIVNDTVYVSLFFEFNWACGAASNLKLADNAFTAKEKFVFEVLPREMAGKPTPNETASVRLTGGGRIDANGQHNRFASCVKFYGAEGSSADFSEIVGCAQRGLTIGDTAAADPGFFNNASDDVHIRLAISGLGPESPGPGVYFHCTGCVVEGPVLLFNGAARYKGVAVAGLPNPAIWIDNSFDVSLDHSYGECDGAFVQITNSVGVHLNDVIPVAWGASPTPTPCEKTSEVGIQVSGNSSQIYGYGRSAGYATSFEDRSTQFGAGPYPTIKGDVGSFVPWGPYTSDPPLFARGIDLPAFRQPQLGTTNLINGIITVPRITTPVTGAKSWRLFVGSAEADTNPSAELLSCDVDNAANCFKHFQFSRSPGGAAAGYQNLLDPAGAGGTAVGGKFGLLNLAPPAGHIYFLCIDPTGKVTSQAKPCSG